MLCSAHPILSLNHHNYHRFDEDDIVEDSPAPCYFLFLRSKYHIRHSVHKRPESVLFRSCKSPSFVPIQDHRQSYNFLYFSLCLLEKRKPRDFNRIWLFGHHPPSCLLFKTQPNSIGLSIPHRKHITSPLRARQVNAIYRFFHVGASHMSDNR
jgi:hypothetical protein